MTHHFRRTMMKWLMIVPVFTLLTACGYTTRTDVIEYQQVVPATYTTSVVYEEPVDVTTTVVDYY